MGDELEAEAKLRLYALVISRYKGLISEKEARPISEVRQRVSPYNDFVRKLRERLLSDMVPYSRERDFFVAVERAIAYVRQIRTVEFAFTFWMDFEEMERLRLGTALDKAILLASCLRSFESEDAKVVVTRKGKPFVRFAWKGSAYFVSPESGSMLSGDESMDALKSDPPAYSFSDLVYENYEDV